MLNFYNELLEGDTLIQHDKTQVQLKLEYSPVSSFVKNHYSIELYFFVPKSLAINQSTYRREDFYRDMSGIIRFMTPQLSLNQLINPQNERSPFYRIKRMLKRWENNYKIEIIEELKLFANIFRSNLRDNIKSFILDLKNIDRPDDYWKIERDFHNFFIDLNRVLEDFYKLKAEINNNVKIIDKNIKQTVVYVDDFLSLSADFYLSGFYYELLEFSEDSLEVIKKQLLDFFYKNKHYRLASKFEVLEDNDEKNKELFLYKKSVLKRFILDVLLLQVKRTDLVQSYSWLWGGIAAGLAMFIYLLLFIWGGQVFVINSVPFIFISVLIYILKDRVKEGLKFYFNNQTLKFFPDFKIKVKSSDNEVLGNLSESFGFVDAKNLSLDISEVRCRGFCGEVDSFARPEEIFVYKKEVNLHTKTLLSGRSRRNTLNDILRFNFSRFGDHASDAFEEEILIDKNGSAEKILCPRVYHINLVMKISYLGKNGKQNKELKRFRVVLNKEGIKRVETL